ncbi:HOG (high osmolarity glycerol) pathway protein [Entomophthora muscae]|uniref:HOG (High osmolarity glycerol) pathway protein n=1 Tax=Entomophthora muscae TaxID=34485 RepID=A0ACC2UFT3_9FUNG|nr:HOG (high osmolarity glycerol) pathway protein [Entomophthora muscae]
MSKLAFAALSDKDKEIKFREEFWSTSEIKVRDYGFPGWDLRHWGQPLPDDETESEGESEGSLEKKSDECTGPARALYDFEAENPSELSFRKGDELYIHYRQCEGWLVGFFKDEKLGLIPENYVEFIASETK